MFSNREGDNGRFDIFLDELSVFGDNTLNEPIRSFSLRMSACVYPACLGMRLLPE